MEIGHKFFATKHDREKTVEGGGSEGFNSHSTSCCNTGSNARLNGE